MCLIPAFNLIIASDTVGSVYLYNLFTDRFFSYYRIHQDDITCIKVHPAKPDILFTCSYDGYVKIWKMPDLHFIKAIQIDRHELWTFTFIKDLLVVGSTSGYIYFYDISNLSTAYLKAKLFLSVNAYSLFLTDSKKYYTNDTSIFTISRKQDNEIINGKQAAYLLNLFNSKSVLSGLFGEENESSESRKNHIEVIRQIPGIMS